MKKETVLKRVDSAINKHDVLKNCSQETKDYFKEIILDMFYCLENDLDAEYHTSSENLHFAIDVTLWDDFYTIYNERVEELERAKK